MSWWLKISDLPGIKNQTMKYDILAAAQAALKKMILLERMPCGLY